VSKISKIGQNQKSEYDVFFNLDIDVIYTKIKINDLKKKIGKKFHSGYGNYLKKMISHGKQWKIHYLLTIT
jgi:hypothetical protein